MVIVPDWLRLQARAHGERVAVIVPGQTPLTWAALDQRVTALAAALRAAGVDDNVRIGALLHNGPDLLALILAAPRLRAPLVLLDPRETRDEVARAIARTGVQLVVAPADAAPSGVAWLPPEIRAPPHEAAPPTLDLATTHTVVFTSGTSGSPKPIALSLRNHLWSALGHAWRIGLRPDDRWLACLPLWHVGGLAIVLRSVLAGSAILLHQRFDPEAIARSLHEDHPTLISLVPTMLRRLLAARVPAMTLRAALVGGAAASPALLKEAVAARWPVAPTYGSTETASQVATLPPHDPRIREGSVGLPLVGTRIRIVDATGRVLPPGESGEIQVRGPTISAGMVEPDGGLVPMVMADGWLPMPDLGHLAPDGSLRVLGRRDDIIVTGGENVAPGEIEDALARLPEVLDVAVAAVPDAEWGQVVGAWIVPRGETAPSLEGVRAAMQGILASYKLPRRLFVVDALPRTAAGKLRRSLLARLHARSVSRR